jgi:predicted amidophosphoribosyltransferase
VRKPDRFTRQVVGAWLDALFPRRCTTCDMPLPAGSLAPEVEPRKFGFDFTSLFRQGFTTLLCQDCLDRFRVLEPPFCERCGLSLPGGGTSDFPDQGRLCGECAQHPGRIHRIRGIAPYDQTFRELIHAYKYGGQIHLARPLATLLHHAWQCYWSDRHVDILMPVPLHPGRFRQRGFNQVYLLLRQWGPAEKPAGSRPSHLSDLSVASGPARPANGMPHISCDQLRRIHFTTSQTKLYRRERQRNLAGAFALVDPAVVVAKRVLLVDDVYTTGATVNACAHVLLEAGAAAVDVLVLARTP